MSDRERTHGFGRRASPDPRDAAHPMTPHLTASALTHRTWSAPGLPLDQGATPMCVGYSCRGLLLAAPVINKPEHPSAQEIYDGAQRNDEFPDTPPADGSSVRGGFKFLQKCGLIGEYVWAANVDEVMRFVLTRGPVVLGINWYDSMMEPDRHGWLHISKNAQIVGGHAILAIGVNMATGALRLMNSWGAEWGQRGRAWLRREDLARLLHEDGEAGAPTEIKPAPSPIPVPTPAAVVIH